MLISIMVMAIIERTTRGMAVIVSNGAVGVCTNGDMFSTALGKSSSVPN